MSESVVVYEIRRVAGEWCAFHPSGREVARSKERSWLEGYLTDAGIVWQTAPGV